MALLSFEGVGKRYDHGRWQVVVLDGASLEVGENGFIGVWGARRSGKSTLLRLAAGIESADTGVVRFAGRDLARMSSGERIRLLRRGIGFVSAPAGVGNSSQTAWREGVVEHVRAPLLSDGWDVAEAATAARAMLDRFGAEECVFAATHELSPGEQLRVALARALIRQPRLLLVDEPAMIPSPTERDDIRELLRSLGRKSDLAVIVASEDIGMLRGARRVLSIGDGRLLSGDRPGEVVQFPGSSAGPMESPGS